MLRNTLWLGQKPWFLFPGTTLYHHLSDRLHEGFSPILWIDFNQPDCLKKQEEGIMERSCSCLHSIGDSVRSWALVGGVRMEEFDLVVFEQFK